MFNPRSNWSHYPLLELNQLVVLIEVVPTVVFGRTRGGGENIGLLGDLELLGGILALHVALLPALAAGLVEVDFVGVDSVADEVLPEPVALLDGLGHVLGGLVLAANDLDDVVTSGNLVVLEVS